MHSHISTTYYYKEEFHHPKIFSVLLLCSQHFPLLSVLSIHWSSCHLTVLCLSQCHINAVMQYISFGVWLLSLSKMLPRFIYVFAWVNIAHSFLLLNIIPLYGCTIICLSITLFPGFMNKPTINSLQGIFTEMVMFVLGLED